MERLRQSLTTDLIILHSMQPAIGQQETLLANTDTHPAEDLFDDLKDEVPNSNPDAELQDTGVGQQEADDITPPERKSLHLPSSHLPNDHPLCESELSLWIKQAIHYLAAIWEAVAEKSFQYSHIIHSAPSNAIKTRSCGVVPIHDEPTRCKCTNHEHIL